MALALLRIVNRNRPGRENFTGFGEVSCFSRNIHLLFFSFLHNHGASITILSHEHSFPHTFSLQVIDQVEESRRKIASSLSVIKRLQESLLAHSASVANQNQTALLEILTPSQSNRFMEWFLRNRDRCARMIDRTDVRTTIPTPICNVQLNEQLPKAHSDHSLNDICKHLTIQ